VGVEDVEAGAEQEDDGDDIEPMGGADPAGVAFDQTVCGRGGLGDDASRRRSGGRLTAKPEGRKVD
jgi:hypothetical protein